MATHLHLANISPSHFAEHWDDMTVLWVFLAVFGYAVRTIPPATNPWAIWGIGILQFFAANWDKILQPPGQGQGSSNSLITPTQANQQAFSAAASQGPGPIQQPIPISISKQEQQ